MKGFLRFSLFLPALLLLVSACDSPTMPGAAPFEPRDAAVPAAAPDAPSDLAAVNITFQQVDLSWVDNSTDERRFAVRRRQWGADGWGPWGRIDRVPANTTTYTDASVQPGGTYRYVVLACNADGCSATSNVVRLWVPPAPPDAPSDFVATPFSATRLDLTWTDNALIKSHWELQRRTDVGSGFDDWQSVPAPAPWLTSRSDIFVVPGGRYGYRLRACNESGCSGWTETEGRTLLLPPPFVESVSGTSSVYIEWTNPNVNIIRYQIARRDFIGDVWTAWVALGSDLPPGTTSYTDTTVAPLTRYRYRFRACDAVRCSDWTIIEIHTSGGGRSQ